MAWTRKTLLCLPLVALAIGGWSAWHASQPISTAHEGVVMLLPGALPALNPFLPETEAERQLLDLIHEPLIRLDREGRLGAALAEQWSWHQNMTCYFTTPTEAQKAAQAVAEQPVEKRATWDLETVTQEGASLILRFAHPGSTVADEVLTVLSTQQPQRLTFLRIASPPSARLALTAFAKQPEHAATTKRLWFDDDGTCEIVSTRTSVQAQQSLMDWLSTRHQPVPEITPMAEVTALLEPVLDFRLKPSAQWPDGTRITSADVKATLDHVLPQAWPLPGRDAFRHIQDITSPEPGLVRVIYRRRYSPALPAWTTLPILPAAWLKQHQAGFGSDAPPGAGAWQIARQDSRRLWLEKSSVQPIEKLQVLASTSPLQTRVGIATSSFDILWPTGENQSSLKEARDMQIMPTPPHSSLMLVWQTAAISDLRVRSALSLALDRQALRREMPGGQARLHDSFFPPGRWFSSHKATPAFDLKTAESLLAEVGWLRDVTGRMKKSGVALEPRLIIPVGNVERLRLANALAQSWDRLGIKVKIIEAPAESYVSDLQQGRFDVALVGSELAAGWDVLPMWHSTQITGRGLNVSQIADAKLDGLLEALQSEFDPTQVPRRAAAVESRLTELQPAIPLFT
ncbi:MAG: ABC transporter substrate-binding protein, partial [Prosthecobacter sp.]